jgi:hypothetical protein
MEGISSCLSDPTERNPKAATITVIRATTARLARESLERINKKRPLNHLCQQELATMEDYSHEPTGSSCEVPAERLNCQLFHKLHRITEAVSCNANGLLFEIGEKFDSSRFGGRVFIERDIRV